MGVVSLRVSLRVSRGVSGLRWGGIGGLALTHLLEVLLRGICGAEDEVAFHVIRLGVVGVFHPHNPALSGVGTSDGAHF